jgi:hypothetical protein
MEHLSKYTPIAQKWPNTPITRCKQLQIITLVLVCRCGMWVDMEELREHRRLEECEAEEVMLVER